MPLSSEEIIRLFFSMIGGGLVTGLFTLWNTNQLERKQKQIKSIRLQLQELYGPLQFFASCNEQLFKITDKIHNAYKTEYINKQYSKESNTQERVSQRALETLEISNQYHKQVLENNSRILEILMNHYSLIVPDDAEIFAQFIVDYVRNKTEYSESRLRTPLEIYKHLGNVSFMRPEFISAVGKRFNEKKDALEKLLK